MARFAVTLLVAALAVAAQGWPTRENDLASAAVNGNWDEVHRLLSEMYRRQFNFISTQQAAQQQRQLQQQFAASIQDLKPAPGGHVYGEAQSSYSSTINKNGEVQHLAGGRRVVNDDGQITAYDLTPEQVSQNSQQQ